MAGKKKKIKGAKRKKPSSKGTLKSKKPKSKIKIKKHVSTEPKKVTKNKRKKAASPGKPKSKNIRKSPKPKTTGKKTPRKKYKERAKIPQGDLKFIGSKNKKINGQWRTICYYKDSKGKKHQWTENDRRKTQLIYQPKSVKYSRQTMIKKLPPNITKGMKQVAKDDYEHSIGMDFERREVQPQRVIIMKGGKDETLKIQDFELFGHTHPGRHSAQISYGDLKNMKTLEPEFIIAGKTGETKIYNVENTDKLKRHFWRRKDRRLATAAVEQKDIDRQLKRKKYKDDPKVKNIDPYNITNTKKGREMFYDITGVNVYPVKEKSTFVEMKDDPKLEKQVPTVPKEYLKKYQNQ